MPDSGQTKTDSLLSSDERARTGKIDIGTVVAGRYEIVRFIANGGMGDVYEAEDRSLHQRVALKTIRSDHADDVRRMERFKREVLLARRVTHRNVCRAFDVGQHGHELFLTMELLVGETLAERVRRTGPMSVGDALPLVEQMVAALAAAHQAGIVHRDFKCSNVMLTADRAVVTDFGLAYDATITEHERSHDGFIGSPAYVAPEQVGGRQVGFAADIYALGVVMFEMLTGRLPFVGATPMATAVLRLEEPAPPPRSFVATIPEPWERVILRCLEREPADRFATVEDVVAALRSQPVAGPQRRAGHRGALPLVAAGVALAGAASIGFWALHPHSSAAPADRGPRTLAVTDLEDRTGDAAAERWRGTAFAEVLAAQLGGSETLHLLPRATTERDDREQLARHGATLVLTGSYHRTGDALAFDVAIVDLRSGAQVVAVEESGPPTALFDVAARAATRLRGALGLPALSPAETTRTRDALPSNPEAARRYTEGLTALRRFQPAAAVSAFEAALAAEPDQALVYSALAQAWHDLESDQRQRDAARRAFELSTNLPREDRLAIEATYREAINDWAGAAQIRQSLATFFPENLDYGLALAEAQRRSGKLEEALATLATLRRLPSPDGDDPRIDVAEGNVRVSTDTAAALAAAHRAIAGARARGLLGVEADGHVVECNVEAAAGHVAEANAACGEALHRFDEQGNKAGVARATLTLARVYVSARQPDQAAKYEQQALALYREIGSRTGEVRVKALMAIAYKRAGDLETAEKLWRECVDEFREAGEPGLMVNAMGDVASVLTDSGHYAEAAPLYRQVIEMAHAQGLTGIEANHSSNFAIVLKHDGELAEARRFAETAVELWTKLGQRVNVVYGLDAVEQIALRQGRIADAQNLEEQALALRESLGQIGGPSRQNLAEIAMERGDLARAEALARKAADEFQHDNDPTAEAEALDILIRTLVEAGKVDEAATAMAHQDQLIVQTKMQREPFLGTHALVEAAQGHVAAALADVRAAIAASEKDGDIDSMMDQRQVLAEILVRHGTATQARDALAALRREASARGYVQALHDADALEKLIR